MADISITTYTNKRYKEGASTTVPGFIEGSPGSPVNPPGSGGASEFVPYVGAINDVDLGEKGLSTGFVTFDTTPTDTPTAQGTLSWNDARQTLDLQMNGTNQPIGQAEYFYVKNSSGSSIAKGRNVRFAGTDGASGHIKIEEFLADGTYPSSYYMGVTAEAIDNGDFGQVMAFGELTGINTSGYSAGDLLYASTTVAGAFQTTAPIAPNNIVLVAAAINSNNNGAIIVRPTLGSNINTDEGVKITSGTTGDLLQLQSNGLWENKSLSTIIGTAYVPSTRQLTINGTAYDLSADRSWNVGTVTSVGLSSATSGVTIGSTPITSSGTITLAIATASGSQQGLLSSTDWTTFNGKIGGSGTTNYVPKFTASGTIGNSLIQEQNSGIGIAGGVQIGFKLDVAGQVVFRGNTYIQDHLYNFGTGGIFTISTIKNVLRLQTVDTERMRITSTGNVLIGTTTDAGQKLQVTGTVALRASSTASTATQIPVFTADPSSTTRELVTRTPAQLLSDIGGIGGTIASGQVAFGTGVNTIGGDGGLTWDNTSKRLSIISIGVASSFIQSNARADFFLVDNGASTDLKRLLLRGDGGILKIGSENDAVNDFRERITINLGYGLGTSPNVLGILTTSPTNTLDVNGTGRIRKGVSLADTSGNVLIGTTSDAGQKLQVAGNILVNTNGQGRLISTFYPTGSFGQNIFIGGGGQLSSYTSDSDGSYNTALGVQALNANTTGYFNTANGFAALFSNTTGYSNTANGVSALYSNTTGHENTANGLQALFSNTTGYNNTANGVNSLFSNTTGVNNTANGVNAGRYINSGGANQTSNNSIYLGFDTRASASGNTNEIVIGASGRGEGSNSVVIGNSSITKTILQGDILIGTTNVVSGHKVRVSGGALNVTNWTSSSGAYDKLSIDFGETRGIGYDPFLNEIFVLGATTTPVKIDTDASTDTLVVSSSSNVLVGTSTDAGQKLQVAGTTAIRSSSTASVATQIPVFTADPSSTTRELVTRTPSELADDLGFGVSSGTFTPTLEDDGSGATYSFTTSIATYTKIGSIVYFNLDLSSISTTGTPSGLLDINGLPFRSGFWVIQDQWQFTCNRLSGTGLTDTEVSNLIPVASGSNLNFRNKTTGTLKTSVTFTSGRIKINGYYTANA